MSMRQSKISLSNDGLSGNGLEWTGMFRKRFYNRSKTFFRHLSRKYDGIGGKFVTFKSLCATINQLELNILYDVNIIFN